MRRFSSVGLVFLLPLATASAVSSCSTDHVVGVANEDVDAAPAPGPESPLEAGVDEAPGPEAGTPARDAAPFDGGPLPVVCATPPCATSLSTIYVPSDLDRGEGYCALLADRSVACWGVNAQGQLGRGDPSNLVSSARAERVVGLSNIVQLEHYCALDADGAVWCWGLGPFLRNDAGTTSREYTPLKLALPPVKSLGMGNEVGCAVVDDGVLCWGTNVNGQVAPFDSAPANTTLAPRAVNLPPGAPVREVHVGKAVFAVREDGVTLSWGALPLLGRVSSLHPDPLPLPMPLADISSIDVTSDTACATVEGVAYCWGRAIAPPNTYERGLPTSVATPEPVVQIATTRAYQVSSLGLNIDQPQRWCAVGASGAVYCWGFNKGGQAGDGTTQDAYEPVKVKGLPAPAAQVKTLPDSTCALLTTGKIYCWGTNYHGQLGNGKMREPSVVPQEVELPAQ